MQELQRRTRTIGCVLLAVAAFLGASGCNAPEVPSEPLAVDLLEEDPAEEVVETRFFQFGTGERHPLGDGWSKDERDRDTGVSFVWATARRATIDLTILQVTDVQVLFEAKAFPLPEPQALTVEVNGQPLADFEMAPLFREYRFVIPSAALEQGTNELAFVHRELGRTETRDSRTFAAAYAWVMAGPLCLPLRAHGDPERPSVTRRDDPTRGLAVLGPAELLWNVRVPQGSSFHATLKLPDDSAGQADVVLEAHRDAGWETIARQRLRRPWIGGATHEAVRAALPDSPEETTRLRLRILPVLCSSATTRVIVEQAGLMTENGL